MIKKIIRAAVRLRRKLHRTSSKQEKDIAIYQRLIATEAFKQAKTILLYAPIPHEKEVDTWKVMQEFVGKKIFILPRTAKSKQLELCIIKSKNDTSPNKLKIPEPLPTCKTVDHSSIDLAIIPGVAFDKKGNRIGFGQGYYDRLLRKLHCPILALAYDFQILHAIPRQAHDMSVHRIITEKKIYTIS